MIRINLATDTQIVTPSLDPALQKEAYFPSEGESRGQLAPLINLFIILIFPVGLYFYNDMTIRELKGHVQTLTQQLNELMAENQSRSTIVAEYDKFVEEKKALEEKLRVINLLSVGRLRQAKSLDTVQSLMPEQAWLKKIEFNDGVLTLEGYAMSDSEVTTLMSLMEQSVYFSEIGLNESKDERIEVGNVKIFSIRSQLEGE